MKGFTLIELMVAVAILGIIAMLVFGAASGGLNMGGVTMTPTGMVSEQCLGGYKFIVDANGNARQILDEFGKGVKCN